MATFRVEHPHALGAAEAVRRVREVLDGLREKFGDKAEVVWDDTRATFRGKGFSGVAVIADDAVAVDVDLSLLLRPLKGRIEARLVEALGRGLA